MSPNQHRALTYKIYFNDTDSDFINYFNAIKVTLPPQIILLIVCDLTLPQETLELNSVISDNSILKTGAIKPVNETINLNTGSGFVIKDMTSSRNLTSYTSILSGDLRNISLTVSS